MNVPAVSVITPVWNASLYLRRCLDSVCNQTLREIEIICVNDASTDNSLEILHEYAAKDNRINIIENEKNIGVAASRNSALAIAQGAYLGFVDSDDAVELDFFFKLYAEAENTNADIIKGVIKEIRYDGSEHIDLINDKIRKNRIYFTNCFWTAIYKNRFIKNHKISFPNGIILGEDLVFLSRAVLKTRNIKTVDSAFYQYHKRIDSMDSKILSTEKIISGLTALNMVITELNRADKMPFADDEYVYRFWQTFMRASFIPAQREDDRGIPQYAMLILGLYNNCKCRKIVDARLSEDYPQWYTLLHSGDFDGITDYLMNNGLYNKNNKNNKNKMMAPDLRSKLRNRTNG